VDRSHHEEINMMTQFHKPLLTAILSATALAGFGSVASAQEQQTTETPATTEAPARTDSTPAESTITTTDPAQSAQQIDDQKIEKFADAYVAVQNIQSQAAKELDSSSADPAKQQETQAAVETQMIAAVEQSGLKLEEFNGIVQTMTADANLRARVVAEIRERTGG
jgi:murein L,D-transpeptidase YcbB/YkuD